MNQVTFKNANFTSNRAQWGGAVASFSSGGSPVANSSSFSPSSLSESDGYWASTASDYDPDDLTPSLTTSAGGAATVKTNESSSDFDFGDDEESSKGNRSSSSAGAFGTSNSGSLSSDGSQSGAAAASEVKFLDCGFEGNGASADGGAICE